MTPRRTAQRTHTPEHFDLLPFIALMMIVLATLLFVTMSMAAINVGVGATEGWIPSGAPGAPTKVPVLVEWDGETVTIQRDTGDERVLLGNDTRRWRNSDWDFRSVELRLFLSDMAYRKETHYVLFAVRPTGFANFRTLASEFRNKGISVGYEPIEAGRTVRLKLNEEAAQ